MNYVDSFIKFESDNKLFEDEIQNIKYWSYIRFWIYSQILKKKEDILENHTNIKKEYSILESIKRKSKLIPNLLLKNPLISIKEKDILVFNHSRRIKNINYYECIYTDELLKNIDKEFYVMENMYMEKHYYPIETRNIRYTDYIKFVTTLKKRIYKILKLYKLGEDEKNKVVDICKKIENIYSIKIDYFTTIEYIQNFVYNYKIKYKYYYYILSKVKPKIIIEVVGYLIENMIINEISKDMNIRTIELQHGTMGKYHIAYNFYEKTEIATFPEFIFTFGQYWNDNTRLPLDSDKVIATGFPYFSNKVKKNKINNKIKKILFVSQGYIGDKLSKLAVDLYSNIDHSKYDIIYKLHPGEYDRWRNLYPWLIDTNIQIIDNNYNDIYYYFSISDYQVGVSSTALFEGLGFNLKTFIYKVSGYEYMEFLYNNNYAELIIEYKDIIDSLNVLNNDISNVKQYFWENDSLQNILSNVSRIK